MASLSFSVIRTSIFFSSIWESSMSLVIDFISTERRFISRCLTVISVSMSMSANDISWRESLVSSYFSSMWASFWYSDFIL